MGGGINYGREDERAGKQGGIYEKNVVGGERMGMVNLKEGRKGFSLMRASLLVISPIGSSLIRLSPSSCAIRTSFGHMCAGIVQRGCDTNLACARVYLHHIRIPHGHRRRHVCLEITMMTPKGGREKTR